MYVRSVQMCVFYQLQSYLLQVWFNNKGYHALPAYLNSLSNTVLRSYVDKNMGNPAAYGMFNKLGITMTYFQLETVSYWPCRHILIFNKPIMKY